MAYWLIKKLLSPLVKAVWVEKVEGIENIPRTGSAILAFNHCSYMDFITFGAVSPRLVFYLAGEVFFKKWWWRPLVILTGQVKVDRQSKDKSNSIKQALSILKQQKLLGIFPEGTRSANGKLQKAYSGVAKIAIASQVNIIPVGLIGTYEIMSRHNKFPKLNKKCRIIIGNPIDLSEYYGQEYNQEIIDMITNKKIMPEIARLSGQDYTY